MVAKVFGVLFALVNLTFGWVVGIGTGEQTTGCAFESEKQLGVGGFSAETSSPPQVDGVALTAAGSAGGPGARDGRRAFQERVPLRVPAFEIAAFASQNLSRSLLFA